MAGRPGRLFGWSVRTNADSARSYGLSGRYDRAAATLDRVHRAQQGGLGAGHRETLATATELGAALAATGRPADAVTVLEDAVRRLRSGYGDDDPQFVDAAVTLRQTLPLAGVYTGAVGSLAPIHDRMLTSSRDDDHAEQWVWTGYHLAVAFRDAADLERALTVLQYHNVLAATEHATFPAATQIEQAALTAFQRMRDYATDGAPPLTAEAVSFLDWCCARPPAGVDPVSLRADVLEWYAAHGGADSAAALTARLALAVALGAQGRGDEALGEYETVFERRTATLPEGHPDTLFAAAMVATSYGHHHRYADAVAVGRPVVDEWRRTLGENHRETLQLARLLAGSLLALDRTGEAEPVLEWLQSYGYAVDVTGRGTPGPSA